MALIRQATRSRRRARTFTCSAAAGGGPPSAMAGIDKQQPGELIQRFMTLSSKEEPNREREFSTMVAFTSALSFGALLAIAQATRVSQTGVSFKLSLWTVVAFLAGFN